VRSKTVEERRGHRGIAYTQREVYKMIKEKLCVMAVDDSPDILKAIYMILKDEYTVVILSDPNELKEALAYNTPDLFLLDYRMPEISGFELVPIIRSFPKHKKTPIAFLTAEGTASRREAAEKLGAVDFLKKPVSADELILFVSTWLR
jgi:DNA-binding response OmpR family regulator